MHQRCLVARDVCQRSWRVVTAIIAWVFVRDNDLNSIGSNVLTLHATVRASRKFDLIYNLLCSCGLIMISYSNVFFVDAFRVWII